MGEEKVSSGFPSGYYVVLPFIYRPFQATIVFLSFFLWKWLISIKFKVSSLAPDGGHTSCGFGTSHCDRSVLSLRNGRTVFAGNEYEISPNTRYRQTRVVSFLRCSHFDLSLYPRTLRGNCSQHGFRRPS